MIHHRLEKLNQLGQSVWYDNLSREMIASGELKKNIDLGVSGKQIIDFDDMKKYNIGLWGGVDLNIAKELSKKYLKA